MTLPEYSNLKLEDPWPCIGGCGKMLKYPWVCCSDPECQAKFEEYSRIDDEARNKVDLGHE